MWLIDNGSIYILLAFLNTKMNQ